MRLYKILVKPIVTEKTANMGIAKARYGFEVAPNATKIDVKMAIKSLYGVEVESVNMLNTREKFKYGRKRGMQIKRRSTKKAYITLRDAKAVLDVTMVK